MGMSRCLQKDRKLWILVTVNSTPTQKWPPSTALSMQKNQISLSFNASCGDHVTISHYPSMECSPSQGTWYLTTGQWSGPRDCSRFKQKCPIFWSEGGQQDPPDGYKYTQCFLDGVKGDKKILLQRSLDARSFEDPCRFCTERGEVCGYEVSL